MASLTVSVSFSPSHVTTVVCRGSLSSRRRGWAGSDQPERRLLRGAGSCQRSVSPRSSTHRQL